MKKAVSILLICTGILSIIFGIVVLASTTGYSSASYGNNAVFGADYYTYVVENLSSTAANTARTANNTVDIASILSKGFGFSLIVAGLVIVLVNIRTLLILSDTVIEQKPSGSPVRPMGSTEKPAGGPTRNRADLTAKPAGRTVRPTGSTVKPAGTVVDQGASGQPFSVATEDRTNMVSCSVPAGTTSIANWAFSGCVKLETVSIPQGVVSVGNKAFAGCKALTGIFLPDGVRQIGSFAFNDCANLTFLRLPASLVSIGSFAFTGCIALKTIRYAGTEEQWKAVSIGENNAQLKSIEIVFGAD